MDRYNSIYMNQRKIANISKALVACSVTAGIFALSLLITIIIKGYEGASGTLSQYFITKYATNLNAGNQRRCVLTSASILCLAAQNILILKKAKQEEKDCQQVQSKTIKNAFLLISISIMCQLPTIGFYFSLLIEINSQFDIFSIRLIVLGEGMLSFLFSLVCWGITLKDSISQSDGQQSQKKDSGQNENAFIESIFVDNREMEDIISKPILQPLFYKQNKDEITRFDPDGHSQEEKLRFEDTIDVQKSTRNDNFIGSINYGQNNSKTHKYNRSEQELNKNEQCRLQKQRLKTEIQRRKKKFRELSNYVINEQQEQNEEPSQQSEQNAYKMHNLPKSYRQYIKDAKKPRRTIKIIDSLPDNFVQSKIVNLIEQPKWEKSALGRRIRESIEKNHSNQVKLELVFINNLKAKERSTKRLFDDDSFPASTLKEQSPLKQGDNQKDRLSKYRKPKTAQQELLIRLRNRYNAIEMEENARIQ